MEKISKSWQRRSEKTVEKNFYKERRIPWEK